MTHGVAAAMELHACMSERFSSHYRSSLNSCDIELNAMVLIGISGGP
jgi:hypothetical protein